MVDESKKSDKPEPQADGDAERAARTAQETGISTAQADQLRRSTGDEGTELDSAAEAAARWS